MASVPPPARPSSRPHTAPPTYPAILAPTPSFPQKRESRGARRPPWPHKQNAKACDKAQEPLGPPSGFEIARDRGWYRVPAQKAPRGIFFEYLAFYFTAAFADLKYAVHYYARNLGHELVARRDLLPGEPDHARASRPSSAAAGGASPSSTPPGTALRLRRRSTTCSSRGRGLWTACTTLCVRRVWLRSGRFRCGRGASSMWLIWLCRAAGAWWSSRLRARDRLCLVRCACRSRERHRQAGRAPIPGGG